MVRLRKRGRSVPLSIHVARYFLFAFLLIAAVWVACFAALSASMEAGAVYPANWGAANAREVADRIQEEGCFDPQSVPTAYRYALFDADGTLVSTDMGEGALGRSREIASAGTPAEETEVTGSSGATYVSFRLEDGTSCVLSSAYMPQFASPALRDSLPNPQNIMLAAGFAGSLAAVALAAARAGRFIGRKLAPLTDAAGRVARQDLEFPVEPGGVREVDEVLSAMDGMRASLKESLEARWEAERRQRDQVAALAHDLKTPLTVIRANAEYVAEETADLAVGGKSASPERLFAVSDAANAAADGTKRLDSYVHLLIRTSKELPSAGGGPASAGRLASAVEEDGRSLAQAAGVGFSFSAEDGVDALRIEGDEDALVRATMNAVSNAVEHASSRVSVEMRASKDGFFEVVVDDDGEGFSAEALEHGREQFFREDSARADGHYGLGLYIASETMAAYGGAIEMVNLDSGGTSVQGARIVLRVPPASK